MRQDRIGKISDTNYDSQNNGNYHNSLTKDRETRGAIKGKLMR